MIGVEAGTGELTDDLGGYHHHRERTLADSTRAHDYRLIHLHADRRLRATGRAGIGGEGRLGGKLASSKGTSGRLCADQSSRQTSGSKGGVIERETYREATVVPGRSRLRRVFVSVVVWVSGDGGEA